MEHLLHSSTSRNITGGCSRRQRVQASDRANIAAPRFPNCTRRGPRRTPAYELSNKPLDRALLATFAELAHGTVTDLGCGPGHVTAYLHSLELSTSGVDLSPEMVAIAR
ncbi:methyltransferase domain-containing protein [Rhodococcus globerulus]|uniref:methyltransferase domain-containing protein n=1 Tax=Rhodococcus globerulus TaxID=33008 RepID=UPI00374F629C